MQQNHTRNQIACWRIGWTLGTIDSVRGWFNENCYVRDFVVWKPRIAFDSIRFATNKQTTEVFYECVQASRFRWRFGKDEREAYGSKTMVPQETLLALPLCPPCASQRRKEIASTELLFMSYFTNTSYVILYSNRNIFIPLRTSFIPWVRSYLSR